MDIEQKKQVKWSPFTEGYFDDPYPHITDCQQTNPVQKGYYGEWILFRHSHIKAILKSPDFITADLSGFFKEKENLILKNSGQCPFLSSSTIKWLPYLNNNDHQVMRELVEKALSYFDFEKIIDNCISEFFDTGFLENTIDMAEVSAILPVLLFNSLFNPKNPKWITSKKLKEITNSLATAQEIFVPPKSYHPVNEVMEWLFTEIGNHFDHTELGSKSFLGYLKQVNSENKLGVQKNEIISVVMLLMLAAIETTSSTLSSVSYELLKNECISDYTLANSNSTSTNIFIEEVFRFFSPQQYTIRINKEAIELNNINIPEGTKLILCLAAANRDPDVFTNANQFIPDRKNNPHIAFGTGAHSCLGSRIARMELRSIIKPLSQKLLQYKLNPDGVPEWNKGIFIRSLKHLPIIKR